MGARARADSPGPAELGSGSGRPSRHQWGPRDAPSWLLAWAPAQPCPAAAELQDEADKAALQRQHKQGTFQEPVPFSAWLAVRGLCAWDLQLPGSPVGAPQRSQPAAEPLSATAALTACIAELARHSRGIRQHTPHSAPAFPCRESQAEHSTAEPRGLRRSHTTTELTAAEDSEGKDRRRRGRAAGMEQGRTRTGCRGGGRDGPCTSSLETS